MPTLLTLTAPQKPAHEVACLRRNHRVSGDLFPAPSQPVFPELVGAAENHPNTPETPGIPV